MILCYRTVLVKTKNPCWNFSALTVTCIIYTCLSFPKTQSQVCFFFSGTLNHVQNTRKTVTAGCVPTTKLDVTTACWSIWPAPHVISPTWQKRHKHMIKFQSTWSKHIMFFQSITFIKFQTMKVMWLHVLPFIIWSETIRYFLENTTWQD